MSLSLREVPGLPDPDVRPPTVAEAGDPFAALRVAHLVARIPRFEESLQRHGLLALVYSRITPGVPWGIVNYATGAAGGRLVYLLIATLAGAPKIFAYVALGGSFDDLSSPEAIVAMSLLALTAIGGIVLARRRIRAERASVPPA